jgi:hypothetical protein
MVEMKIMQSEDPILIIESGTIVKSIKGMKKQMSKKIIELAKAELKRFVDSQLIMLKSNSDDSTNEEIAKALTEKCIITSRIDEVINFLEKSSHKSMQYIPKMQVFKEEEI